MIELVLLTLQLVSLQASAWWRTSDFFHCSYQANAQTGGNCQKFSLEGTVAKRESMPTAVYVLRRGGMPLVAATPICAIRMAKLADGPTAIGVAPLLRS